jgi:hypothetical protein
MYALLSQGLSTSAAWHLADFISGTAMNIPSFGKWPTTQLTWLIQLLIGSTGAMVIIIKFAFTGLDAPPVLASMIVALLAVERLAFVGKRKTEFTPEQHARAEAIKNGADCFGNGK